MNYNDKIKLSLFVYDKEYSVTMPDDINFVDFMEENKSLTKIIYSEQLVDNYWK